ncbi:MAG: PAS domain S-box protein, partial [Actinomycetota bacterium]|nr:PAS domain S-box protein [Actinomycetota bacterium]
MLPHRDPVPEHLRLLPSTDADVVLHLSPGGRLLAASDGVAELLGWDLARLAEEGLSAVVEDEALRAAVRQVRDALARTGTARRTLQLPSAAGPVWLDVAAKVLRGPDGPYVHVNARDVTEDLAETAQLTASEQQWRVAFEHSPIGGALLDPQGGVLLANDALCAMLGWRPHELSRLALSDFVALDGGMDEPCWWGSLVDGTGGDQVEDRMLRTADGHLLWARLSASSVPAPAPPRRVMVQLQDITERREAELQLANRALHDSLTGAPNRFLTRQWLSSALEDHPGQGVGVLYCDLDRFKVVNDSLGHGAG